MPVCGGCLGAVAQSRRSWTTVAGVSANFLRVVFGLRPLDGALAETQTARTARRLEASARECSADPALVASGSADVHALQVREQTQKAVGAKRKAAVRREQRRFLALQSCAITEVAGAAAKRRSTEVAFAKMATERSAYLIAICCALAALENTFLGSFVLSPHAVVLQGFWRDDTYQWRCEFGLQRRGHQLWWHHYRRRKHIGLGS